MASSTTTTVELVEFVGGDHSGVAKSNVHPTSGHQVKVGEVSGEGARYLPGRGQVLDGDSISVQNGSLSVEGVGLVAEGGVVSGDDVGVGGNINGDTSVVFPDLSMSKAFTVILAVAGVNFLNDMGGGLLTVALPTVARDLGLGRALLLW
ncbi:hypothetical protein G7Y89_g11805 [Cudoniella acicularis]|uniref:Major facilitator superfamily (MFS) profile domain-containing protein n=1 Tax=Cudoniella acicularis TaxID=354080 RepID=A0A8H4VZU2_9HELO|nr:hypothetical protein G7Y89_g11805 [Cudoniella acicularis]